MTIRWIIRDSCLSRDFGRWFSLVGNSSFGPHAISTLFRRSAKFFTLSNIIDDVEMIFAWKFIRQIRLRRSYRLTPRYCCRKRGLYDDSMSGRTNVPDRDEFRTSEMRNVYLSLSAEARTNSGAKSRSGSRSRCWSNVATLRNEQHYLSKLVSHRQGRLRHRLCPGDSTRRSLRRLRHVLLRWWVYKTTREALLDFFFSSTTIYYSAIQGLTKFLANFVSDAPFTRYQRV